LCKRDGRQCRHNQCREQLLHENWISLVWKATTVCRVEAINGRVFLPVDIGRLQRRSALPTFYLINQRANNANGGLDRRRKASFCENDTNMANRASLALPGKVVLYPLAQHRDRDRREHEQHAPRDQVRTAREDLVSDQREC